jgi:hypothetical protein
VSSGEEGKPRNLLPGKLSIVSKKKKEKEIEEI